MSPFERLSVLKILDSLSTVMPWMLFFTVHMISQKIHYIKQYLWLYRPIISAFFCIPVPKRLFKTTSLLETICAGMQTPHALCPFHKSLQLTAGPRIPLPLQITLKKSQKIILEKTVPLQNYFDCLFTLLSTQYQKQCCIICTSDEVSLSIEVLPLLRYGIKRIEISLLIHQFPERAAFHNST